MRGSRRLEQMKLLGMLLEPRRGSDGWVRIMDCVHDLQVSRASVYRWFQQFEEAGFPIEYGGETGCVRCTLLMRRRDSKQERREDSKPEDDKPRAFNPAWPDRLGLTRPIGTG